MSKIISILFVFFAVNFTVLGQTNNKYENDSICKNRADNQSICANIPNNFTPDRDGIDDEWCIKSSGANKLYLWLWNRWGNHIIWDKEYDVEDNKTVCLWDNGIGSGGTNYPEGTYYYRIKLKNTNTGAEREFQGSIQLWLVTHVLNAK